MRLGTVMRQIRNERGLTQADLAKMMKVSDGTVSNLEIGRSKFAMPSILKFCIAMKIPLVYLIARATEYKDLPSLLRQKNAGKYRKVKVMLENLVK